MENLGKIVIEHASGRKFGFVLDVALGFDSLKKEGYYVVDEETEGEYLLRNEDIEMVGDVLIVSDFTRLEFVPNAEKSLIGRQVLGSDGRSLGYIERVVFEKNKLKKFCTDKGEISAKLIGTVGEDTVFLKGKSSKKKEKNIWKTLGDEEQKVVALDNKSEHNVPEKINLSFSFFDGKFATNDVFGYNNERIISKNQKITKNIFENAKKHNKLNELFFASKK